jgi:hypothetical protein
MSLHGVCSSILCAVSEAVLQRALDLAGMGARIEGTREAVSDGKIEGPKAGSGV